jgi:Flp pilus assembly protein TadG
MRDLLASQVRRRRLRLPEFCRRLRDEEGSALVELGFIMSLLGIPLFLGTIYFATLLMDQIEIDNAAHAGAIYAMTSSTFAEDSSNIVTAAQEETPRIGSNLSVSSSIYYVCSTAISGTQYSTQSAATTACTGGTSHSLEMIQVTVSASVTPVATFPGLAKTPTLSSTSIMEVEE